MKSLRDVLTDADHGGYAIGHFNFATVDVLHAIAKAARDFAKASSGAAREADTPVIFGTSEGERSFVGMSQAVALVRSLREQYDAPFYLNADHTYSVEGVQEAVQAGYDMVIFDGAELLLEENIEKTKRVVEYARSVNAEVVVEAELGYIGKSSKLRDEVPEEVLKAGKTTPEEAREFVEKTGIDALAPSVGNLHGIVKGAGNPDLDIERIRAVREAAGVPLFLHGGSGIRDEQFQQAIQAGISVVHINTEIRKAWRDALSAALEENPEEIAPYRILDSAQKAAFSVVQERIRLFNNV